MYIVRIYDNFVFALPDYRIRQNDGNKYFVTHFIVWYMLSSILRFSIVYIFMKILDKYFK